jgi:hypothetical protein
MLVVLSLCAGARAARATGDEEWQLSARLGAANKNGSPLASWGPAFALDLEYGFDDAWAGRVSVGSLAHPVPAVKDVTPGGTLRATTALVGATYTFDVLRLVPYAAGGLGVVYWSGGGEPGHAAFAAELGVGADYLLTPHWSWGGCAQYLFAPGELASQAMQFGEDPLAFSITMRVSRIF